ncbi:hypothetical protein BKA67DRAFT_143648 [Truncatella angustata]|uniref:Protein kinase domain-containing protein n=1 Tax=Truncatella angustata TaxID=152316 RepID=A0A9P8RJF9_9PEZI|nr:uncharacterized protein BKA67DRAFT_143648 [Truncatella angustata]KAH6638533.1 hypothetical protein BKA67DRAFT_143648 [Truncatella angustata]
MRRRNIPKTGKVIAIKTWSVAARYEPSDIKSTRGKSDPRSRQFDIWSMGCVLLERYYGLLTYTEPWTPSKLT